MKPHERSQQAPEEETTKAEDAAQPRVESDNAAVAEMSMESALLSTDSADVGAACLQVEAALATQTRTEAT